MEASLSFLLSQSLSWLLQPKSHLQGGGLRGTIFLRNVDVIATYCFVCNFWAWAKPKQNKTLVNILFCLLFPVSNMSASSSLFLLQCLEQIQSFRFHKLFSHTPCFLLSHCIFPYVSPSCHCQTSKITCLNDHLFLHQKFPLTICKYISPPEIPETELSSHQGPFRPVLSNRIFCNDENVLYLRCLYRHQPHVAVVHLKCWEWKTKFLTGFHFNWFYFKVALASGYWTGQHSSR